MRIAAIAAIVMLAGPVGCGDDDDGSASSPVAASELTITLDPDGPQGDGPAQVAELSCPGANAPPAACDAIDGLPENATDPVPPATACTQVYGGPDLVTIEGKIEGEEIDTGLTRTDGCEIERFEHFVPLLEVLFPDYEPGAALGP